MLFIGWTLFWRPHKVFLRFLYLSRVLIKNMDDASVEEFFVKFRPFDKAETNWKRQQCRSNVWLCRKNRSICSIYQRCFDIVAGVDGALDRDQFTIRNVHIGGRSATRGVWRDNGQRRALHGRLEQSDDVEHEPDGHRPTTTYDVVIDRRRTSLIHAASTDDRTTATRDECVCLPWHAEHIVHGP